MNRTKPIRYLLIAVYAAIFVFPACGDDGGGAANGPGVPAAGWVLENPDGLIGEMSAIEMTSPAKGFAVGGDGGIYRTTDGGKSWSRMASPTTEDLYDVAFGNANNGIAISIDWI